MLYLFGIGDLVPYPARTRKRVSVKLVNQLFQTPSLPCDSRNDGNAERTRKRIRVNFNPRSLCFVYKVNANNQIICDLEYLKDEPEAVLKRSRIANGNRNIRSAEAYVISRDLLFMRMGEE